MARVRVQVPGGNFKSIQVSQSTSGGQDPGVGTSQNPLTPAQQATVVGLIQAYANSFSASQQVDAASSATSTMALAAGSNTQIQYNNAGVLGASAQLTYASGTLTVAAPASSSILGLAVSAGSGNYAGISLAGNGNTFDSTDFEIYQSSAGVAVIANYADEAMTFYTDGTERMSIAANGDTLTFIAQALGAAAGIYCDGGDITAARSTTEGALYLGSNGTYYIDSSPVGGYSYGSVAVNGATNNYVGVIAAGNEALTLMDSNAASTKACGLYSQTASGWMMFYDGTNVYIAGDATGTISLCDNVYIPGTLNVGSAKSQTLALNAYSAAAGDYSIACIQSADSGTMEQVHFLIDVTTSVGSISSTTTATAYNTSSDRRLKQNIKVSSAARAAEIIDALQVREFDWIRKPVHVEHGFIAQELNEVMPSAVSHNEKYDEWGVDYSKLVPVMVAEIQALRARVAALEHAAKS